MSTNHTPLPDQESESRLVTVAVDLDTHKSIRVAAAERGISIRDMAAEILRNHFVGASAGPAAPPAAA